MFKKLVLSTCLTIAWLHTAQAVETSHYRAPLEVAAKQLLNDQWEIFYTRPEFRKVILNYSEDRQVAPKWSDILDDAGKRHGIAFLIDMEKYQLIATPIDGFRTAGVHYVQSRITQHQNRYRWNYWIQESQKELAQHEIMVANQSQRQRDSELAVIRNEFESQYDTKVARLNEQSSAYNEQSAQLTDVRNQLELEVAQQKASLMAQTDLYEKKSHEAEQAMVSARASEANSIKTSDELLALQDELKSDFNQKSSEYKNQLDQEYKDRQTTLAKKETNLQKVVDRYYPPVDRVLPAGDSHPQIKKFLSKYWGYGLSWSDNLLDQNMRSNIALDYDLNFEGDDLASDVSKIVCAMTRDIPSITIYSVIDPKTRLVVMQMHKGSFTIREQILAQCYE
jgi:hypothetical protein